MRQLLKEFFSYTRGERNGILVLTVLLIVLIIGNLSLEYIVRPAQFDAEANKKTLDSLYRLLQESTGKQKERQASETTTRDDQLFRFNPNQITVEQWQQLGVSAKTAEIIQNYQDEGGRFRTKQDLLRIYGFSRADYQRLAPYIQLPSKQKRSSQQSNTDDTTAYSKNSWETSNSPSDYSNYSSYRAALNQADSTQLEKVYGIGPAYASRIVKYRNLLGGYRHKKQLKEIYGLDSAAYERIKPNVFIQDTSFQKININTASVEDLGKHPYISWNIAYIIVNYKKQHGSFEKLSKLKNIHLVNDSLYHRLKPYLEATHDRTEN